MSEHTPLTANAAMVLVRMLDLAGRDAELSRLFLRDLLAAGGGLPLELILSVRGVAASLAAKLYDVATDDAGRAAVWKFITACAASACSRAVHIRNARTHAWGWGHAQHALTQCPTPTL